MGIRKEQAMAAYAAGIKKSRTVPKGFKSLLIFLPEDLHAQLKIKAILDKAPLQDYAVKILQQSITANTKNA